MTTKQQGQAQSVEPLTHQTYTDFLRIVAAAAPNTYVTVNHFRDHLDAAGIPPAARGGLMAHAVHAGYLTPSRNYVKGIGYVELRVTSTNGPSRTSSVRVYLRTSKK